MPRGASKKSKCRCRLHEIPDRQPSAADSEMLDFAAANGWIVFTHDLDFGMLPGAMKTNSPSVVQMRCQDVLPAAVGDMVVRAILIAEPHLKAGALVTTCREWFPPNAVWWERSFAASESRPFSEWRVIQDEAPVRASRSFAE